MAAPMAASDGRLSGAGSAEQFARTGAGRGTLGIEDEIVDRDFRRSYAA